ncbi:hypothetical protein BU24DRAFT_222012 [Aaosphaeria arxii CBS 175.79]|uniref:Uncharacterized protein n=1 Tax=Aaosphaeria arxii CBS 175.79 TaxID=1450172 RepID=A0A6A5XQ02_9PLEO|nr:uncharacterized protein BU24DRAFT_222012 [Aaosphaeria arxii CBS 175.79]KAF2014800.1 hypothetical protein BU24DRAFT_222012 [Aaosphaeria arxii CBS 175.79]
MREKYVRKAGRRYKTRLLSSTSISPIHILSFRLFGSIYLTNVGTVRWSTIHISHRVKKTYYKLADTPVRTFTTITLESHDCSSSESPDHSHPVTPPTSSSISNFNYVNMGISKRTIGRARFSPLATVSLGQPIALRISSRGFFVQQYATVT